MDFSKLLLTGKNSPLLTNSITITKGFTSADTHFSQIVINNYDDVGWEIWYVNTTDSVLAYSSGSWEIEYKTILFDDNVNVSNQEYRALIEIYNMNNLKFGDKLVSKLKYGNKNVLFATLGDTLIYSKTPRLPLFLQEVKYLGSNTSGTQFLILNYYPNERTKIICKFKNAQDGWFRFAGETSYNTNAFHLYATSGNFDVGFRTPQVSTGDRITYKYNTSYTFELSANGVSFTDSDGYSYNKTFENITPFTSPNKLFIGALGRGTTPTISFKGEINEVDLYENNVSQYKLIPCYFKTTAQAIDGNTGVLTTYQQNKPCMYDLVNNKVYVNQGTGADFIVGADVDRFSTSITYNQKIPNSFITLQTRTSVVPSGNTMGSYISIINPIAGHKVYAKITTTNSKVRCCWYKNNSSGYDFATGELLDASSQESNVFDGIYEITEEMIHSDTGYLQLYYWVYGGATTGNHTITIQLIDLTALGMQNIISLPIFKATDLGKLIDKGVLLPYANTNKVYEDDIEYLK